MFMYAYFLRSVETRIGQQNHRVGFTQQFPYPGTLEAGGEVAQAAAQIARARYEAATRDVIVDLKISVHELAYLRRAETITRQNQDILNQILAQTITLYAGGDATLNDLLRAQSQAAQLEYDVLLLEELAAVEIAKIAGILDLPASTVVGPTATVPYLPIEVPIEELEARALAGRQEITIDKLVANKAAEAIDLAVLQTKPMFSFDVMTVQTGGALMPGTRDDGKDPWTIGLGVSLPWSSEKNSSRVREAELQRDAALARKDALARQTATDVHKLYSKLRNAQRLVELYQDTLIPEAAAAMQIAQEWHRDSPKDVSGFLETQTVWLNFNLARVRAIADYQLSLARMERLLGSSVEP
jgi:outer membrane protein TolC